MKPATLASIGSFMILVALYLFPFGQDIIVLWLTDYLGSQTAAWNALYAITTALAATGILLGGGHVLRSQFRGIFRFVASKPALFIAIIIAGFLVLQVFVRWML